MFIYHMSSHVWKLYKAIFKKQKRTIWFKYVFFMHQCSPSSEGYSLKTRVKDKIFENVNVLEIMFGRWFCLFDLILYVPANNFSVIAGWVFLG